MALKVIGAGLGRTGTASLKFALEQLGFGPCYHMSEVLANPGHVRLWCDVAAGRPDFETLFRDYAATVDFPACIYWRELAQIWPQAKVVLTVRDAAQWYRSTQDTIFNAGAVDLFRRGEYGSMFDATIGDFFGGDINSREHVIRRFNAHIDDVRRGVPRESLLVFDVRDGWVPLCEFLGVPVPEEAFPYVNTTADTLDLIDALIEATEDGGELAAVFDANDRLGGRNRG